MNKAVHITKDTWLVPIAIQGFHYLIKYLDTESNISISTARQHIEQRLHQMDIPKQLMLFDNGKTKDGKYIWLEWNGERFSERAFVIQLNKREQRHINRKTRKLKS